MRSTIIRQSKGLSQICESASRRCLTSQSHNAPAMRAQSITLCNVCAASQSPRRSMRRQAIPQRRMQSTSTSTNTASDDASAPQLPSNSKTHYDLFPLTLSRGPPPSGPFNIDLRALRNEYLRLQATAHPDVHPGHLKARAEGTSALINTAYKTLQSPLLRAQYLLELQDIDVGDETAKVEDETLLMNVLEAREEIEDVQEEMELDELRERNKVRMDACVDTLGRLMEEGKWEEAGSEAVRLRYWVGIKDSIDAWEKGKGGGNLQH